VRKPPGIESPAAKKAMKHLSRATVWAYRRTHGRVGGKWRVGAGFGKPAPVLLLEHVGRKSGRALTTPLLYVRDGGRVLLVASQGGAPGHPQWYLNLRANPEATVQIKAERLRVRARTATPQERAELWPRMVEMYADFDDYQSWADREIALVIHDPL
jgi:deazaflavin-dependent oxidoreductase (nitroreductase family)